MIYTETARYRSGKSCKYIYLIVNTMYIFTITIADNAIKCSCNIIQNMRETTGRTACNKSLVYYYIMTSLYCMFIIGEGGGVQRPTHSLFLLALYNSSRYNLHWQRCTRIYWTILLYDSNNPFYRCWLADHLMVP